MEHLQNTPLLCNNNMEYNKYKEVLQGFLQTSRKKYNSDDICLSLYQPFTLRRQPVHNLSISNNLLQTIAVEQEASEITVHQQLALFLAEQENVVFLLILWFGLVLHLVEHVGYHWQVLKQQQEVKEQIKQIFSLFLTNFCLHVFEKIWSFGCLRCSKTNLF